MSLFSPDDLRAIRRILDTKEDNFVELGKMANLNPAMDYVNADLLEVNFTDCDLGPFNFKDTDLVKSK